LVRVFFGIFMDNGNPFVDAQTTMLLVNNVFFLALCCIACTPVIPKMRELCEKNQTTKKLWTAIGVAMPAILVILSACALAGDSYNPFMYFQF
jgi:alginate O-acetyltransferase complex protein AlgI